MVIGIRRCCLLALALLVPLSTTAQPQTVFENSNGEASADYDAVLAFYRQLVAEHPERACLREHGDTDVGEPLQVLYLSSRGCHELPAGDRERPRLLILNAIHPGEPAGVSASQLYARTLLQDTAASNLDQVDIAIVAAYNIGGMLNRGAPTRANQRGPEAYGFRGNARNFDLNRDFAKADSRNAASFARLFHAFDPDLFLDTHTTNGADYQHTISILATQADQLGGQLGPYFRDQWYPQLEQKMAERDQIIVPYVNVHGSDPAMGWTQFLDLPRYSTGFAALFQTPGMMSEAHMLKPFSERVDATLDFLQVSTAMLAESGDTLRKHRLADRQHWQQREQLPVAWEPDPAAEPSRIAFHGYRSRTVDSPFGKGEQRLVYDTEQPYAEEIDFRDRFRASATVTRPVAWVVPRGWHRVIQRLQDNSVQMHTVEKSAQVQAEVGRITVVESLDSPWEGHFYHRRFDVDWEPASDITLQAGDRIIPSDQPAVRYLTAVLSPESPDSFARWNFFDPVLARKEYFSDYLFEDHAAGLLADDSAVREAFEAEKNQSEEFARSRSAQLQWLYQRSRFSESAHMRYPTLRVTNLGSYTDS